jgi:hypothetical protein
LGTVGVSGLSGGLGNQQGLGGSKMAGWVNDAYSNLANSHDWTSTATGTSVTYTDSTANTTTIPWQQFYNTVNVKYGDEELDVGGHNTDYSQWWYDPGTRQWDDGTGNKFQCLPVGVSMDQTSHGKQKQQRNKRYAYEEGEAVCFIGRFTPIAYADWLRGRLQRLYAV